MTVGGWILFVIFSVLTGIIVFGVANLLYAEKNGYIVAAAICLVLTIALFAVMHWWFNNTARGKRAFKTQESNFGDGIERVVRVYDVNGGLIETYDGKFDITYDDDRVLFDDENGKRHIIYYPTGTVLIDEK